MGLGPCLSLGNMRRAAWSIALGLVIDGGADLWGTGWGERGFAFATTDRVVGGNGVVVFIGRYAGVASALAWGTCWGLGSGRGGAAWGGR